MMGLPWPPGEIPWCVLLTSNLCMVTDRPRGPCLLFVFIQGRFMNQKRLAGIRSGLQRGRRRKPAQPDYLAVTFKHRPVLSRGARDAALLQKLYHFLRRLRVGWPETVARAPVTNHYCFRHQRGVEKLIAIISRVFVEIRIFPAKRYFRDDQDNACLRDRDSPREPSGV